MDGMAMGSRKPEQIAMFLTQDQLPQAPTAPCFVKLNELLDQMGFDAYVEQLCRPFYAARLGRPSLVPGVYFRLLLGYLLGIDSERGSALNVSDSLGLRAFLGYELQQSPPDHSTISRTRRRISLEVHEQVFGWVLGQLREAGLAHPGADGGGGRHDAVRERGVVLILCLFRRKSGVFPRIKLSTKLLEIRIL